VEEAKSHDAGQLPFHRVSEWNAGHADQVIESSNSHDEVFDIPRILFGIQLV
jgi:hypothetical protein